MVFGYVYETGKRKENEDALLFRSSLFTGGELDFIAVCDGMGGVGNGAEAAFFCIREMEQWFDRQLIPLTQLYGNRKRSWESVLKSKGFRLYRQMNEALFGQMRSSGKALGSTALMGVIYQGRYYLFHIGDSRGYLLKRTLGRWRCHSLTKVHGNEWGLSRCMGLNREWKPDFVTGRIGKGGLLLCSDGFWRKYDRDIWAECLNPMRMKSSEAIRKRLREMMEYNMRKGEQDNISAIYIACGDEAQN